MLVHQIFRFLAFRSVKHPHVNLVVNIIPAICSIFTCVLFFVLPVEPTIFTSEGLLSYFISLCAILPGFYIAALSAVATFNSENLDTIIPDPTPTIEMKFSENKDDVDLTLRAFLSYLFSYLTGLSFILFFISALSVVTANSFVYMFSFFNVMFMGISTLDVAKLIFLLCVFYFLWSILICSAYGVYFLSERIHRPHA